MVKRAADHSVTIYDMVRDPALYNLPALLDAADLALAKDQANLEALYALLDSPDSGLRYWGIVGCFLLNDQSGGLKCLEDSSHEVRAMAAWVLVNTGKEEQGLQCLGHLLETRSYATLTVLNMIDWMGGSALSLRGTVEALKYTPESYEEQMKLTLLERTF